MLPDFNLPILLKHQPRYPSIQQNQMVEPHSGLATLFANAGLDPGNPFSQWIQPGMRVLIKPNWVRHAAEDWSVLEALITHPSLLRPVVEYVARALTNSKGFVEGEIILADAPLQSANFELLLKQSAMSPLLLDWRARSIPVHLRDLRRVIAETDESTGVVLSSRNAPGDASGDTEVDIGTQSRLEELLVDGQHFGVSNYDSSTTSSHHHLGVHRYRIANSLLGSHVVINLPKWKTHVKTGVTGALKNFIGINCDKAYLPHFRVGPPSRGGDEYPDSFAGDLLARLRPWFERVMPGDVIRSARKSLLASKQKSSAPLVFGGAWPGNDTLWRTIHDMVFIARWLGPNGVKLSSPRPILTLLDAIVAGEGDGPLRPEPRDMGCLLFGTDPAQIDVFATALSGFDWRQIPALAHLADPAAAAITQFNTSAPLPRPELLLKPPAAWAAGLPLKEPAYEAA
jgi:uncharacterized protein (DUF362 family)